jgi:lambda family phage tail tape measure protein
MADKDLRFKILAQVIGAEAVDKFNDRLGNLDRTTTQIKGKLSGLSSGIRTLASAFILTEAVRFTKSLIDAGDELNKLSQKTGVAVGDLAGLKGAADLSDVSFEGLTGSLTKLSVKIVDAAAGSREASSAFSAVGVSFKTADGQIKQTGTVVKEIADKFANMQDGPGKAAIAVKLFGKTGAELIPLLNQGSEALSRYGLAIDGDFAQRAEEFNDTLTRIGMGAKNFALSGVKEVLPTLQEIGTAFEKLPSTNKDMVGFFQILGESVRIAAIGFNTLFEVGVILFDKLAAYARIGGGAIIDIIKTIGDSATTRAKQLKALFTLDFDGASRLGQDLEKRTTERGKVAVAEREKLLDDQEARAVKRAERIASVYGALRKNSLLLGSGTEEEILKRQAADTAPKSKTSGVGNINAADLSKDRDRVKEFIEQQRLENDQRKQALGDINLTALQLRKVTEARKLDADAIKYSKTMTAEQRKELMLATEEIQKQRAEIIQQEFDMKRTYSFGAKEYLRDYLNEVTNNANAVRQVFSTTFNSLENTLVDFITTGKMNFRNFATSVISELARIAVRQAVLAPLAGALSSAIAGATTSAASAPTTSGSVSSGYNGAASSGQYQFANGGIMTAKVLFH